MRDHQILRITDVSALVALSRATIYRKVRAGTFPRPLRLGSHAVGWMAGELEAWIEERRRERDKEKTS
jgi:prophage regulatory protein